MEQPESKSCPVKTQRKYTQAVRQRCFGQKTATTIQENAGDIYAEAKDINEARAAKEEEFEDTAGEE